MVFKLDDLKKLDVFIPYVGSEKICGLDERNRLRFTSMFSKIHKKRRDYFGLNETMFFYRFMDEEISYMVFRDYILKSHKDFLPAFIDSKYRIVLSGDKVNNFNTESSLILEGCGDHIKLYAGSDLKKIQP